MTAEEQGPLPDRRKNVVSLDPAALSIFRDISGGMSDVAKSDIYLADVLAESMRKQFRYMRWWMGALTIGVLVLIVFLIANRYAISDAQESVDTAVATAAVFTDCVDPSGVCYKRNKDTQDAYVRYLTDQLDTAIKNRQNENRKTLAQEILCYTENLCPPEYDRDHIPDLEGIYPPPTTTTTGALPGGAP